MEEIAEVYSRSLIAVAQEHGKLDEIRAEVADLTVLATEKVTRKTLTDDDQRKLVEDALAELDFSSLAGDKAGVGSEDN